MLTEKRCIVWKKNDNGTKTGIECTFFMPLINEPNNSLVVMASGFLECVDTNSIQFPSLVIKPFIVTIAEEEGFPL